MEQIGKEEAALMQLCDAIEFYYKGRHVSSITLAGAAEDILGRFATKSYNDKVSGNDRHDYAEMTADIMVEFPPENSGVATNKSEESIAKEKAEMLKEWNETRNEVKHNKDRKALVTVKESFKAKAEYHISNAIINYKLYRNELPNEILIQRYCRERGIN